MVNKVAVQMHAMDILAPLGCHHYFNKSRKQWEVTLFASSTETVGGKFDGQISSSKFTVNLAKLQEVFSDVAMDRVVRVTEGDESFHYVELEAIELGAMGSREHSHHR